MDNTNAGDQEKLYGGLTDSIVRNIMSSFGIDQEHVDKVKAIIDNVDIQQEDDTTTIRLKTKDITVVINK
tara:strand:- start:203 stop:412 length:210 start_codon:yes stop_codon:yes gene_type:complete